MAPKLTPRDVAHGQRLKEIRDGLGLNQPEMAERLTEAAKRLGLPANYEDYKVSRMESGSIRIEEAAVWLSVDPLGKKAPRWDWFIFGPKAIIEDEGGADEDPPETARRRRIGPRRRK